MKDICTGSDSNAIVINQTSPYFNRSIKWKYYFDIKKLKMILFLSNQLLLLRTSDRMFKVIHVVAKKIKQLILTFLLWKVSIRHFQYETNEKLLEGINNAIRHYFQFRYIYRLYELNFHYRHYPISVQIVPIKSQYENFTLD